MANSIPAYLMKTRNRGILTVGGGSSTLNMAFILRSDGVFVGRDDYIVLSRSPIAGSPLAREAASLLKRIARGNEVVTSLQWLRNELNALPNDIS